MFNMFMQSSSPPFIAMSLMMLLLGAVACSSNDPRDIIAAYRDAHNDQDMDKAMSYLADDFRLVFVKEKFVMNKEELRKNLGWDYGANARSTYEDLKVEGYFATGIFTEENDFYKALGIKGMKARVTYRFNEKGLIAEQLYEGLPDQPDYKENFKPALEWVSRNYPEELPKIYPDNHLIYTAEAARRWVALLKEWREATQTDK